MNHTASIRTRAIFIKAIRRYYKYTCFLVPNPHVLFVSQWKAAKSGGVCFCLALARSQSGEDMAVEMTGQCFLVATSSSISSCRQCFIDFYDSVESRDVMFCCQVSSVDSLSPGLRSRFRMENGERSKPNRCLLRESVKLSVPWHASDLHFGNSDQYMI